RRVPPSPNRRPSRCPGSSMAAAASDGGWARGAPSVWVASDIGGHHSRYMDWLIAHCSLLIERRPMSNEQSAISQFLCARSLPRGREADLLRVEAARAELGHLRA